MFWFVGGKENEFRIEKKCWWGDPSTALRAGPILSSRVRSVGAARQRNVVQCTTYKAIKSTVFGA